MTSQVLHNNVEATYITVETASFYGVKQTPSRVLVNSQDAAFTYRDNQVRLGVNGQTQNFCPRLLLFSHFTYMHQQWLKKYIVIYFGRNSSSRIKKKILW